MTNLEIQNAYVGNIQVSKLYLGGEAIWPTTPPVPVEDPMLRQPLTLEITSLGTSSSPQLGLCLSGWTSSAVTNVTYNSSAATYITYTINDDAPQIMALSGAVSNGAITKGITGLSVGDVIRFYATSGNVGSSWFSRVANRHALGCESTLDTHFVHTDGLEVNVYGNINSLLVTKDEFELYAAGDNTVQFNASAYTFGHLFIGRSGFTFGTPTSEKHIVLPEPTNGLQNYCYRNMFYGCTSLTTAPELPASALTDYCYDSMFRSCTGLTSAPALPAETLASSCYSYMFYGCTNLNYIKCLATETSTWLYTNSWVRGVASTGTFVKDANTTWSTGTSAIPTGWTIIDAQ